MRAVANGLSGQAMLACDWIAEERLKGVDGGEDEGGAKAGEGLGLLLLSISDFHSCEYTYLIVWKVLCR